MNTNYTSIFKINGLPILPPLMTEAVRLEMRQYRMQACKLEERLQHVKELMNASTLDTTQENGEDVAQGYVTCKSFGSLSDLVTEVGSFSNGRDSPLFIPSSEDRNVSKGADDLSLVELTSNLSVSERSEGVIKSASDIPVTPPDVEEVPQQRVRSNSYTLEAPSPHLANFLKQKPKKLSPYDAPAPKVPLDLRKVKSKVDTRLVFPKNKKFIPNLGVKKLSGTSGAMNKGPRTAGIGKAKNHKITKKIGPKIKPVDEKKVPEVPKVQKCPEIPSVQNQSDITEFLCKIEAEHKVRMQELLDMQLEEQKKFRETFNEQQKLLLESLKRTFPDAMEDANGNDTTQLSFDVSLDVSTDDEGPPTPKARQNSLECVTQVFLKQHLTQVRHEVDPLSARSAKAASVINAHVRGYLVRRLLRTEAVQQIIQTFHDTRLFLIELHRDSQNKNSNPTDVELKRRLLQQLSSSLGSLHGVFFELPVGERMDIIAKDRDALRLRLQRATERRGQSADLRKGQQQLSKMKVITL